MYEKFGNFEPILDLLLPSNFQIDSALTFSSGFITLISAEDVTSIDLVLYIIQASIIAVGDNSLTLFLEGIHIIYNLATKECTSIFQGWLINDDLSALCLDTLHDALDGRLAEVIAV